MEVELIAQGAESKLYRSNDKLIKERIKKLYRIREIDESLRSYRNKREANALKKAYNLIKVPKIIKVAPFSIEMEYIDGDVLRDVISDLKKTEMLAVCKKIGSYIRKLHEADLIHGDLTTSNMMLKNGELFFIDFGLSEVSKKAESKAVDLHVLKEALESKHYDIASLAWKLITKSYGIKSVLERLKVVETRGRKKLKV